MTQAIKEKRREAKALLEKLHPSYLDLIMGAIMALGALSKED